MSVGAAAVACRRPCGGIAVACLAALALCGGCQPREQTEAPAASPPQPDLARAFAAGTWVDLTHAFDDRTIYWPTDERGFGFEAGKNGVTAKGYYYAANRFATAEHGGTHVDAPRHFAADAATAAEIVPARLVGEAAVIDVTRECAADAVYEVTVDDLRGWEERHGRQLVDMIVLLRTGWSARWGDRAAYLGTAARGPDAVAALRFPGLAADAARWLVEQRRVRAVGIDTASIDPGPATLFPAHVLLCGAGVPIFENVAALETVPERGAFVAALPMKISGGSGGPLRIVARLPDAPAGLPARMGPRPSGETAR